MDAIDLLLRFVGQRLIRIRRIFFTHRESVARGAGPLELMFEPDGTVLLDVGADGESLSTKHEAWQDPFGAPLSQENETWVTEHGKWAAFNESDEPAWKDLVGRTLTSVTPLLAAGGNVCGARLTFDSRTIDFVGSADEALVFLDRQHDLRLAEMKVFVGQEARKRK